MPNIILNYYISNFTETH